MQVRVEEPSRGMQSGSAKGMYPQSREDTACAIMQLYFYLFSNRVTKATGNLLSRLKTHGTDIFQKKTIKKTWTSVTSSVHNKITSK